MKRLRFVLLLLAVAFAALPVRADKTLTGRAVYYGEDNDSRLSAKRKALEQARIQALAKEFGTVLTQVNISRDEISNGSESNYFGSLSESEVKGEWLGDVDEPKYKFEYTDDGQMIVTCTVTIRARALSNKAPEFYAMPLRNGFTEQYESTDFRSGDDLFMKFRAPVNGYVAAYLRSGQEVITLLPYVSSTSGKVPVKANRDYVFFSAAKTETALGTPDEYSLTSEQPVENMELYVLFSPHEFSKALDRRGADGQLRVQNADEFMKWLIKARRADDEMGMKKFNIIVTEK